jgi:6-phosphogluconolactonase
MAVSIEVKIYPELKKLSRAVAGEIDKIVQSSLQQQFHLALSGGNTPKKLFKILAEDYKDKIPWERIHFWWGDERCVSPISDESNFKMANDLLFTQVPVPSKNIHRIKGENFPQEEAERYAGEISKNLLSRNGFPVFDLILLGLGDDGHTASIFPDRMNLLDDSHITAVAEHPQTGQKRITLTGKVLNNANRVFFLITGENKALRISEIMNNEEAAKKLPANYIDPTHGELIWFLDEAAASKIS